MEGGVAVAVAVAPVIPEDVLLLPMDLVCTSESLINPVYI